LLLLQFKLDTLTQQLQLSHSENERVALELTSKSEEFAKYRRAKHSEISELQTAFDSLTETHATMESSFKTLQSVHAAQNHQLTQALTRVQDITSQLAEQEATYSSEASGLKRLVEMMEDREKHTNEIVGNIEKDWAEISERAERREAALKEEVDRERSARQEAEKRADQLQTVLHSMDKGTSSSRIRGESTSDVTTDGIMGLSPTVAMISKVQKSGKTFSEVYADYVRLQEEYNQKCLEIEQMERTMGSVLIQIQERVSGALFSKLYKMLICSRPRLLHNSARSMSDCSLRPRSLLRNLPKPSLIAIHK
jgi:nucleoprotein TPR